MQWLGLHASPAEGPGSVPGQGTNMLQAMLRGLKKKRVANPIDSIRRDYDYRKDTSIL